MNVDQRSLVHRAWGRLCRNSAVFLAARFPGFMSDYLETPVFMIGSPRGGTSMLAYLLTNHSAVSNYSEANEVWEKYLIYDRPFWMVPYRDKEQWAREKTSKMRDEIKTTFSIFHYLSRKKVFLNKCHRNTLRLNEVVAMYPGARFINVIRDGRYVINSILKHEMVNVEVGKGLASVDANRSETIMLLAEYWNEHVNVVENAIKQNPDFSNRVYNIKYEDFCSSPRNTMVKLFKFIGLDEASYDYTVLNEIKESKGCNIDRGEYAKAEKIMGSNLVKYDYELWNE